MRERYYAKPSSLDQGVLSVRLQNPERHTHQERYSRERAVAGGSMVRSSYQYSRWSDVVFTVRNKGLCLLLHMILAFEMGR